MQETPTIETNYFAVVAPVNGKQEVQKRTRSKIICESERNPFWSFLTGDHIRALSIPASAVNDDSIKNLERMKSLQYVVVLGDGPRFKSTDRLRRLLPAAEIVREQELVDSKTVSAVEDIGAHVKQLLTR